MDHDDLHLILDKANELLEAGKPEESLAQLAQIEDQALDDEDRIECFSMKAWALSDLGRHAEALELLDPLVEEFPDSSRLLGALGVVLTNAGDLDRARDVLEEAVRIDESDESAIANLALVHERMRDYRGALELYEKAVEMGADIDWLLQRKAAVHTELGDTKSAKASLRRYLSLAPDDVAEWINLAILHSDDSEYEQAFACYREAEKIAPDSASLRLNWGVSAVRAGELSVANQQLRYLERGEPDSSRAHLLRAFILEENRNYEQALEEYDAALATVNAAEPNDLAYALEMGMDFAARRQMIDRCEALFATAYTANACTVELCEAYREAVGGAAEEATWFSLMIEADYRPGLIDVPDHDQVESAKFTRYQRNFQVVARDRDEALSTIMDIMHRFGEQGVSIREFVGEETMKNTNTGIYEIERESLVYGEEAEK
ncbi:MAG: tetratricopeptide repeat protein [Phycisphaerales bacterium]|nr:tetratricopeptide repeat protein [Phycisphaerales bacterium]